MEKAVVNWGIDLVGRRMRHEPWPIDMAGKYRTPAHKEIEDIYGVSGEAVQETLLAFEQSDGDSEVLIRLLNEHIPHSQFTIDRESLLDPNRWYNNEYYFYFIMFTKKVMGDYNWRFTKGEGVQLSVYHKLYEMGYLRYVPYGGDEKGVSHAILYAIIQNHKNKYDLTDFYDWVEVLVQKKTSISYKDFVSKLDNYWICSVFNSYVLEFLMIVLNKNNVKTICYEAIEFHNFLIFSYVPESMLISIFQFVTNKSSNEYRSELKYNKKDNSVLFDFRLVDLPSLEKKDIYQPTDCFYSNAIAISASTIMLKKLFNLPEMPEVKDVSGECTARCLFTLTWKKRVIPMPYLQLLFCNISAAALLLLNSIFKKEFFLPILLFFLPVNILLIVLRRLKIEKDYRRNYEERIIRLSENNTKRVEELEKLSNDLMMEKKSLEENVKERTKELAKANEQLKELDRAKTAFFANISHELRTPLTLILSPLEAIINGRYGISLQTDDTKLSMMLYNGSKLLKLINNLLDFTKIEAGRMVMKKQKTNIAELLKFYTSIVKPAADYKNININFNDNLEQDRQGKLITWVDRDLLEKAVFNLLSNSLKFTNPGGGIIIQLDNHDDQFSVSVKDTGIGIPEDKLDLIFEKFIMLDSSASRKYEGTGIGLALTKEIVEIMGGNIRANSRLGEGSVFTITLPCGTEDMGDGMIQPLQEVRPYLMADIKPRETGVLERKPDSKLIYNGKILIVEDSTDMQRYLTSLLDPLYRITLAGNGKEGLAKAASEQPDLILADVMMPEMDGHEMIRRIKAQEALKVIPIILLTARADLFMKIEGFEIGADDYLEKPFNADELKARIKVHFDLKRLRDNLLQKTSELEAQKQELEHALAEKVLAYQHLSDSDEKFREIAEHLPAAIIETDLTLQISYINQAGLALFGLEDEIASASDQPTFLVFLADLIHSEDKEKFKTDMQSILRAEQIRLLEYRILTDDGAEQIGLFKISLKYKENKIAGLRVVITEVQSRLGVVLMPDAKFYTEYQISPREKEILDYIIKGFKNKDIGEKLFISEVTVKKHTTNILNKTRTLGRRELMNLVRSYRNTP